jgi:hypothetical protein
VPGTITDGQAGACGQVWAMFNAQGSILDGADGFQERPWFTRHHRCWLFSTQGCLVKQDHPAYITHSA